MEIEYYRKNNYGREDLYVKDQEKAYAIRMITGQKTLGITIREGLERLGFRFKEVLPPTA